ncbi:helix-turn-helix domain-containing protein [Maribacter sp. 2307UL18-2]|uniref:helix-turn-helix domain-containing protein n=1 Tax=Maribacter sp. 2307UL18-2 TaxID=3386274 RepID=UPI0039BD1A83
MYLPLEELLEAQKSNSSRLQRIEQLLLSNPIKRYSPQEISENTPLSTQTVLAAIKDGRIKAQRFGRKYLITAEEFERVCKDAKSLKYKRSVA